MIELEEEPLILTANGGDFGQNPANYPGNDLYQDNKSQCGGAKEQKVSRGNVIQEQFGGHAENILDGKPNQSHQQQKASIDYCGNLDIRLREWFH